MMKGNKKTAKNILTNNKENKKDLIFCLLILAYPVIHFCIFYITVNISSFSFAFQTYFNGEYIWNGFNTFKSVIEKFSVDQQIIASIKNSLIAYVIGMLVGCPLSLIFSYCIYKKIAGYKFFRIMLFLPSIVPALVMVLIYKYFFNNFIYELGYMITGVENTKLNLIYNLDAAYWVTLFYSIFMSFGVNTLIYAGTMNSINESVVEASKLDGVSFMQEFWYVTLPLIYPTITTFLVVGIASIFTNQMNLFGFYGPSADNSLYNFGYYLYRWVQIDTHGEHYPELSALGLLISFVVIIVTLVVKRVLEKVGPSVD